MKQIYFDNVDLERENRRELLKGFHVEVTKVTSIINRFLGIKDKPINFNHLITLFKINEWVHVNDKVKFRLLEYNDTKAVFDTIMQRNGAFGAHRHDDCLEVVEIVKGVLFDASNETTYKTNQTIIIEAGREHAPIALEATVLKVTFKKIEL